MVATARVAAQLVAIGRAAGLSDEQITDSLTAVAETSVAREFWITDATGRVVGAETGSPTLLLEDLATAMAGSPHGMPRGFRHAQAGPG